METAQTVTETRNTKSGKAGTNPGFGMNMPMMSSAFDTSMWLNAGG
jgi:hypothetical protein